MNVIVAQSAAILELFSGENKSLLVWRNTLLILDLGLRVFDSVAGLDFQGEGLAGISVFTKICTMTFELQKSGKW